MGWNSASSHPVIDCWGLFQYKKACYLTNMGIPIILIFHVHNENPYIWKDHPFIEAGASTSIWFDCFFIGVIEWRHIIISWRLKSSATQLFVHWFVQAIGANKTSEVGINFMMRILWRLVNFSLKGPIIRKAFPYGAAKIPVLTSRYGVVDSINAIWKNKHVVFTYLRYAGKQVNTTCVCVFFFQIAFIFPCSGDNRKPQLYVLGP